MFGGGVDGGDVRAGEAVEEGEGARARAAAQVHDVGRARERDPLDEIHRRPETVVAPAQVLGRVPRRELRHASCVRRLPAPTPMHSSTEPLYSQGMSRRWS